MSGIYYNNGEHAKPGQALKTSYSILPDSFRFVAMCAKNLLLPTPAIRQTSAAVLSEFSYKIRAFSNFAGSVLGLPPVLPRALADERPAEARSARNSRSI